MDALHSRSPEDVQPGPQAQVEKRADGNIERFIRVTFEKLPSETKVLIALFAALNTSAAQTKNFDLPNELWNSMRFNECGPLVGESEEVNWLKGICDGIILVSNYS